MQWPIPLKRAMLFSRYRAGLAIGLAAVAALSTVVLPHWLAALLALGLGCLFALIWFAAAPGLKADPGLHASERTLLGFVEQSLVGLYVVQDERIVYANRKLAELLGYDSPEQLVGTATSLVVAPEDQPMLAENQRRRASGDAQSMRYIYRAIRRDGQRIWLDVHGSVCQFEGRPALLGIALDVSRQLASERETRLASRVFDSVSEGIVIIDANYCIEAVNPAFTRITGYSATEAVGKLSRMMTRHGARDEMDQEMLAQLARDGHWQGDMNGRRKNGEVYPVWLSISTVRDAGKKITNYVGVFVDNTSRKEAETRLQYLASHDSLTGMLNRSALMTRFAEEIELARAESHQLALLFIDLDRFKNVNDTLGHRVGDQLLVAVAGRMRRQIKDSDLVARLGGDEFTVLLKERPSSSTAGKVAERVIRSMSQPFMIEGQEMFVTASIGIACYPDDGSDAATLIKNADIAMYRAKQRGKNTFQPFTKDMNTQAYEQMRLENSLRHALERGEFELYYQPQINTRTGKITGVEALIRWHHPELGLIMPNTFIPLAEQNGLIVSIGAWVLHEACRQGKAWLEAGWHFGRIAVNLSARQFSSGDLLDIIRAALDDSGLPPAMLEFEITESTIMHNPPEAIALLDWIRGMGIALSIDDFGTGYSSMACLKQYPLDSLKVDRSFVKGVPDDIDDVAITEAIIAIAHKMGLKVVAEGVETIEQADFLRAAGCDIAQGFLLGRPMPAAELMRHFADR